MTERIVKAFYHTSRRACVPWTAAELVRRVGMSPDEINGALISLSRRGLARALKSSNRADPATWELTEAGKVQARAIVAAEIMMRSV